MHSTIWSSGRPAVDGTDHHQWLGQAACEIRHLPEADISRIFGHDPLLMTWNGHFDHLFAVWFDPVSDGL